MGTRAVPVDAALPIDFISFGCAKFPSRRCLLIVLPVSSLCLLSLKVSSRSNAFVFDVMYYPPLSLSTSIRDLQVALALPLRRHIALEGRDAPSLHIGVATRAPHLDARLLAVICLRSFGCLPPQQAFCGRLLASTPLHRGIPRVWRT